MSTVTALSDLFVTVPILLTLIRAGIKASQTQKENHAHAQMLRQHLLEALCKNNLNFPCTLPEESVWISPRRDGKGVWIALFNLGNRRRTVSLSAEEADLPAFAGKELWSGKALRKTKVLRAALAPHDAAVWHLEE